MASAITFKQTDGKTYGQESVTTFIERINAHWSWADFTVEYKTTEEALREAISNSDSRELKKKVKNIPDKGAVPKSGRLKAILNTPIGYRPQQTELQPNEETAKAIQSGDAVIQISEETNLMEEPLVEENEVVVEEAKETIEPLEASQDAGETATFCRVRELEKLQTEVADNQKKISEIEEYNASQQDIVSEIDARHEQYNQRLSEILLELEAIQRKMVEDANRKIAILKDISDGNKTIENLKVENASKAEEMERLKMVRISLDMDQEEYPEDIDDALKPNASEIQALFYEYAMKDDFLYFTVKETRFVAKVVALVRNILIYDLHYEIAYDDSVPVKVREAIQKLSD